jgi:hypothetical protein
MTNEELAQKIGEMAEAGPNYVILRNIFRGLTLDELQRAQRMVADLKVEIDEYERKAR